MANFNRIIIVGNLTRDPDYKQLENGQAVCRLGLASNRQYRNRQTGNMMQEVCFVDVDVWGAQAESCNQYLQKGRQVLIEGRLKFDQWQDNEGQNRSRHTIIAERVVFLGGGQSDVLGEGPEVSSFGGSSANNSSQIRATLENKQRGKNSKKTLDTEFKDEPPFEDELPF